jgi:hypothetical protein
VSTGGGESKKPSINEAQPTPTKYNKREVEEQNTIAAPLHHLVEEFVGYKDKQDRAEQGKRRREVATIIGLFLTAFLTLGLGIVGICQTIAFREQVAEMKRAYEPIRTQAEAAREQTELTHPPRIQVKFVTPDGEGPAAFKPGQEIKGSGWLVNSGSSVAYQRDEFYCFWYWRKPPLPARIPWGDWANAADDRKGRCNNPLKQDAKEQWVVSADVLKQGDIALFSFTAIAPESYTEELKLYILGVANYRDRLGTPYPVFFARWYDFGSRRFQLSDDKEYETENSQKQGQ